MTIETIYIPTVKRSKNQITFNQLPDELKRKTTMVVQHWEKDQYHYDCNVLVLPDDEKYHVSNRFALSNTRQFIYELGQDKKYAMFDDDITFVTRNNNIFNMPSNMDKTRRKSTHQDILDMFDCFDKWLDEPNVSVCGCSYSFYPPNKNLYQSNTAMYNVFFINGPDFKKDLPKFKLTEIGTSEDVVFILSMLAYGYGNRVSNLYSLFLNNIPSVVWNESIQSSELVLKDQQTLEQMFPGIYKINNELKLGLYGHKAKIEWKKCFGSKLKNTTLNNFLE